MFGDRHCPHQLRSSFILLSQLRSQKLLSLFPENTCGKRLRQAHFCLFTFRKLIGRFAILFCLFPVLPHSFPAARSDNLEDPDAHEKFSTPLEEQNPLLMKGSLPRFAEIKTHHFLPATSSLIASLSRELENIDISSEPSWMTLMHPLERIKDELLGMLETAKLFFYAKKSPEMVLVFRNVQKALLNFESKIIQNPTFYKKMLELRAKSNPQDLSRARLRILEKAITNSELAGVNLPQNKKERLNCIRLEIAELGTEFITNVQDATASSQLLLTSEDQIAGLQGGALIKASRLARENGYSTSQYSTGPWLFILDYSTANTLFKYLEHRQTRENAYHIYHSRAASGDKNNWPIIERILKLRLEQAQLLGYSSYAEMSLRHKMAKDLNTVNTFLSSLERETRESALDDLRQVKELAASRGMPESLDFRPWDLVYWSEQLRSTKYGLEQESERQFFNLSNVLGALFELLESLFQIRVQEPSLQPQVWHKTVRYFEVFDSNNQLLGSFFLDPYSDPERKRGGAWVQGAVARFRDPETGGIRHPVAYVMTNQSSPSPDGSSSMCLSEVKTLFHEFGHALQHILTQVDEPGASGFKNVEWDAIEIPSKFMENWLYEEKTFFKMARHVKTCEPLSREHYQRRIASRNHLNATWLRESIAHSILDLEIHSATTSSFGQLDLSRLAHQIKSQVSFLPYSEKGAALSAFTHIFSGSYAAGYYSYLWSDVLSADVYSLFEEAKLINDETFNQVGRDYLKTFLALGGSVHPLEVFIAFRGREPSVNAFLKQKGLK